MRSFQGENRPVFWALLALGVAALGAVLWASQERSRVAVQPPLTSALPRFESADLDVTVLAPLVVAETPQAVSPTSRDPAPGFTLGTLDGQVVSLSDYRGQRVLINFWATWCPPCRFEMPAIESVYRGYSDRDFVVLGVNLEESPRTVQPFVKELGLSFPILMDTDGEAAMLYGVRGLPTSVFVDRDGMVAMRHIGPMDEAFIEQTLAGMP